MNNEALSLSQLTTSIKSALQSQFPLPVWVVAEISELNTNRSGHCYLELIEKEPVGDKIAAKCRATIWAFAFRMIKPYFETSTGETLKAGLKILIKATVEFHEVYGISLNITDIDPNYTVGEMARKKVMVMKQLEADGVIDMNLQLSMRLVPQRIAVISSETAAGFGDFTDQLATNAYGFDFYTQLFPALMQGEQAPESIIQAFEQIYNSIDDFDVVALLRGGGSKSDLSCFDDYSLSYYITQFPLPVVTGIGHERDDSVVDMVAHTRLKTPTAVAGFFIEKAAEFYSQILETSLYVKNLLFENLNVKEQQLQNFTQLLQSGIQEQLSLQQQILTRMVSDSVHGIKQFKQNKLNSLERMQSNLINHSHNKLNKKLESLLWQQKQIASGFQHFIKNREQKLLFLDKKLHWADPQQILDRGFAIVTQEGKIMKETSQLNPEISIRIRLANGILTGRIEEID